MFSKTLLDLALNENNCTEINELPDYAKLRLIVDFITGMTDQFAVSHFQKISGQKII